MKRLLTFLAMLMVLVTSSFAATTDPLCFTAEEAGSTVSINDNLLLYSTDGVTWSTYTSNTKITLAEVGDKVCFKTSEARSIFSHTTSSSNSYKTFILTGKVAASGNVMSLIDPTCQRKDVPKYCFRQLFKGCTSLTTAPELPATTLASYCYCNMFQGCTSLTTAPELPATTLSECCYYNMFYGCTSLTTGPYLPASNSGLVSSCYSSMFKNCTSLNKIRVNFSYMYVGGYWCAYHWLDNVAPEGTVIIGMSMTSRPIIPSGWHFEYVGAAPEKCLCFTAEESNINVGFAITGTISSNPSLLYSTDGESWKYYTFGENITLSNIGDKVYFLAGKANSTFSDFRYKITFSSSGKVAASGSIMTLLDRTVTKNSVPSYAFYKLFENCTNLTTAPELPATSVGSYSYYRMFSGCTSLTTAPELPATSVDNYSYYSMFSGCTALTTAPELPATSVGSYSYSYMFSGCTRITTAPALRATTLGDYCYQSMFKRCTRLATPPILPATSLAEGCYQSMFEGCVSLTRAPKLSATYLYKNCYAQMFKECSNLTTTPDLPASTLASYCYEQMFKDCSSLNKVSVNFLSWGNPGATSNWLSGVANTGTFTCSALLPVENGTSRIPEGWTVDKEEKDWLCFTAEEANVKVAFKKIGSPSSMPSLFYRLNDGELTKYSFDTEITLANEGDKVIFTAENLNSSFSSSSSDYINFSSTGKVAASGSVMSLLDANIEKTEVPNYGFYGLFKDCIYLTKAPRLPATTLGKDCYASMFEGCTSLEIAPELPATTITDYCYASMFKGCTSLISAPELPASTMKQYCYASMFRGCTSLTETPLLQASELAQGCYTLMFEGCTQLYIAPALQAATLKLYCYDKMFKGCTSLEKAQTMYATTAAMYSCRSMYEGCTNLVNVSPLNAKTVAGYCYQNMFKDCTSLKTAPQIQASSLAEYCCYNMFKDCTSLKTAPQLPVTTLKDHCYDSMFDGCSSLNYVKAGFNDFLGAVNPTMNWLNGVAETGEFVCPDELEINSVGPSTVPNGWIISKSVKRAYNEDVLTFTAEDDEVNISFTINGTFAYTPVLLYSTDGINWVGYAFNKVLPMTKGDKVYFMAVDKNATFSAGPLSYINFTSTGKVAASGNIMYLLDSTGKQTSVPEYAFKGLFRDCTGLTSAPTLPATTVSDECYGDMFRGTSITTAPELPATVMESGCYWYMFYGCEKLTTAPALPATELAPSCYSYMFAGCSALTEAPALPATKMYVQCYSHMFNSCFNLTAAPELPATELALGCYYNMFGLCEKITAAPALPATTLASSCYMDMFQGCTNLASAPALPAKTLKGGCYTRMFSYCKKINSITAEFTSWDLDELSTAPTEYWLEGVAETGKFYCPQQLFIKERGTSTVPEGWSIEQVIEMPENCLAFTAEEAGIDIAFAVKGTLDETPYLYYSTDGLKWDYYTLGDAVSLTNKGDKAYFMAVSNNKTFSKDIYSNYVNFTSTGKVSASGSIMTLLDYEGKQTSVPAAAFAKLFKNCAGLVAAPTLPATKLADGCYAYMFSGTGLTTAPELPADSLTDECYQGMFSDCKSLTVAPALPAEEMKMSCYASMFSGCTSLTTAPVLPAKTMENYCYGQMFKGCTNLTTAPELPATTIVNNCYYRMFSGCTKLNYVKVGFTSWKGTMLAISYEWLKDVAASGTFICPADLAIETLGVSTVPEGWTFTRALNSECLTFTAEEAGNVAFKKNGTFESEPVLVYSTDGQTWKKYNYGDDVNLAKQGDKVYFSAMGKNETFNEGKRVYINLASSGKVAASGSVMSLLDYTCKQTSVPELAFIQLFKGNTALVAAPKLPATTLSKNCYTNMFNGCTSLTKAPDLPATTLAPYCYYWMFANCSSLNSIKVGFTGWNDQEDTTGNSTSGWLTKVASTGTFYCTEDLKVPETRDADHVPVGWNVVTKVSISDLAREIQKLLNGESTKQKVEQMREQILNQ